MIGTNSVYSSIGGGYSNNIGNVSRSATITGGWWNDIGTNSGSSTIGGGADNSIADNTSLATITGGYQNAIGTNASYSSIGGGYSNNIGNVSRSVTIAGGCWNDIGTNSDSSTIGGGADNSIADNTSLATITGGYQNAIGTNASYSAIGGGAFNFVHWAAKYATIPGGFNNHATNFAFAAGSGARATHTGAFVWADNSEVTSYMASDSANSVTMRASGGYRLFSNPSATSGVQLAPGSGAWTSLSDRNAKENFTAVNSNDVLAKVAALPMSSWNYKTQDRAIRHLGPTAQDFKAAFGLGESETGITTIDADGVALAAIQGLNQKVEAQRAENAALKQQVEELRRLLTELGSQVNGGGQ